MKTRIQNLLAVLALCAGTYRAAAQGFVSSSTNNVGNSPTSVVAADVNGDGRVDLIAANYSDNTLTVLTNNGSGGFVPASTNNVGNSPASVIAADVNGDGKVDLISLNSGDSTLTVLTNNGSGGFGTSGIYGVSNEPQSVVTMDINGDGKVDLVALSTIGYEGSVSGSMVMLTNNGTGGFGFFNFSDTGTHPGPACTADVNGDGKVDLVCALTTADLLEVFINEGDGLDVESATFPVGESPISLCAADVNGDGKLDLIDVNEGGDTLTVLTNNFAFPPPSSTPLLTVKTSRDGLLMSWPSASAGWSLQQDPDLKAVRWGPGGYNGYPIADNGRNKSLVVPSQLGNLFFRLMHP